MAFASLELIRARDAAQRLLDHLGLETYLFEVEPGAEWQLRVECAAHEGWCTATLPVDKQELLASAADTDIYSRLLDEWRARLEECRSEER